jgi:type IV secretion system protein VirB8
MKKRDDVSPDVQDQFTAARELEQRRDGGDAAEKSALNKEAKRLIDEAKKFERSRESDNKKMTKAAIIVAGVSVALNFLLGAAIVVLTPLKTVEPYVMRIHDGGSVTIETPLSDARTTYGEEADKFFISQYVVAREAYDWNLAQRSYDIVKSYSIQGSSVFNEYDSFIKSPKSPLAILTDKARVEAPITSITLDAKTSTATVRFAKTVIAADGKPSLMIPQTFWIATLSYGYPNPKLTPDERRLNPLGMKIPAYQLVQERIGN